MKTLLSSAVFAAAMILSSLSHAEGATRSNIQTGGYFVGNQSSEILGSAGFCTVHVAYYKDSDVLILKQAHSKDGFACWTEGKTLLLNCQNDRCENKDQNVTLYTLTPNRFLVAIDGNKKQQIEFNYYGDRVPTVSKVSSTNGFSWTFITNIGYTCTTASGKVYSCDALTLEAVAQLNLCNEAKELALSSSMSKCQELGLRDCHFLEITEYPFAKKLLQKLTADASQVKTGCEASAVVGL